MTRAWAPGQWGTLERLAVDEVVGHVLLDDREEAVRAGKCGDCREFCAYNPNAPKGSALCACCEVGGRINRPQRYEHDCDECKYLGRRGRFDVYIHERPYFSTWTARYEALCLVSRFSSEHLLAQIDEYEDTAS